MFCLIVLAYHIDWIQPTILTEFIDWIRQHLLNSLMTKKYLYLFFWSWILHFTGVEQLLAQKMVEFSYHRFSPFTRLESKTLLKGNKCKITWTNQYWLNICIYCITSSCCIIHELLGGGVYKEASLLAHFWVCSQVTTNNLCLY